jgi:hypothetical protein
LEEVFVVVVAEVFGIDVADDELAIDAGFGFGFEAEF